MPKLPNLCRIKYKASAALLKVIKENSEITLLKLQEVQIDAAIFYAFMGEPKTRAS